jgi:hypothetical protein
VQVTTFTTVYLKRKNIFLKRKGNIFLKSNNNQNCFHPHTVVSDSPGCKDILSQMTNELNVRFGGLSIDLEHLDIKIYFSAPNLINIFNAHLGTVCRIFVDLSVMGWWTNTLQCTTLQRLV